MASIVSGRIAALTNWIASEKELRDAAVTTASSRWDNDRGPKIQETAIRKLTST